jgi:YD repeat-containing protein
MRSRVHLYATFVVLFPSIAAAQNVPPDLPTVMSPLKSEPDPNGVNVLDGMTIVDTPAVLSTPGAPRLTFDRVANAIPYILGEINHNDPSEPMASSWSAHFGQERSESFQCVNDDQCHNVTYSGSNFTLANRNVRQAGSGALFVFSILQSRSEISSPTNPRTKEQRYASSVHYPDGEQISYTYEQGFVSGNSFPSCTTSSSGTCQSYFRPTRVGSNTGYYITIDYQYTGTDAANSLWKVPAQAALYSPSNVLVRRLVYTGYTTITDYGNSATNVGGRVFTKSATGGLGFLETNNGSIALPGEASNQLSIVGSTSHGTTTSPLIDSVTRDGVPWTYTYANARSVAVNNAYALRYDSLKVLGPNGYNVTYTMDPNVPFPYRNILKTRTDALGHSTHYAYDYSRGDRLVGITMPEGNAVNLTYDDCGNILTKTSVPKAGSGLSNIVESAIYPDPALPANLCPSVLSYRPTSSTDALGRVTNYTYNSLGQLTQRLDPAVNGTRRQTNMTYQVIGGVSRPTAVEICGGSSCTGNAESRTEYTYWGITGLPLTVTQVDEATAQTRTTTYNYDPAGRVVSIDGPLAGTADAKYFQYDRFGRKTWEVGELAPNNLRIAKKYTYRDSDDKVTNVQTGTVSCTSACNTAALTLTLLQQTDTTYDSRRYPIRETTYKSGTPLSVTDRSFLDRGLAECSAARMNMTTLPAATAHGACALGTQGTQGPDRIAKNSYDNAGELIKVQKAYLTADQADYATYTYTPNGKQEYLTDANGNKARFVHDGFDRLSQWQVPSKTAAGTVNASDYEQYGYDGAGNRVTLRKRDGSTLTFTYDALNRMTSKLANGGSGGGGTNNPPVANADTASTTACGTVSVNVVANDTDPDGNYPLHVAGIVSSTRGSVDSFSSTTITFTGAVSSGTGVVQYLVADSLGATSTGTASITISGGVCP